jgi:uncharacterized protein YjbI with pentapeptide repeats
MIKFNLFNNFNTKKKIALIALLILALLVILGKNYISEVVKSPSIRIHLINIAKVAIPLKNLILMRNVDDKIVLLKSSGSCVFCDLTQGNFIGNDLQGVDLRYAILIGADLNNTNLSGADLSNTNLSGVDLSNTDLTGTILVNASLAGSNLSGADLSYANLSGTDLYKANIQKANLRGANLDGVDLSHKDLTGTILVNASLAGSNLSGADLYKANIQKANLRGANLDGVDLSHKDLTGTILSGVDLSHKDLTGTNLSGVNLRNHVLTGTILVNANFVGADLYRVDLSHKDLTGTILTQSNLAGANLSGVDLSHKDLTGTILSGVDLSNTDLTGTILVNANLAGANLDGVDLSHKDLTRAILYRVDLSHKDLTGTILTQSNLTRANLSGVDLSHKDLTGTIIKDAKKIEISLKNPSNSNWPALNDKQNLNVTRYDLSSDVHYLATKEGFLFESKNNESRLVLDLNTDAQFPFSVKGNGGLFGIASKNKLVYVSYSSEDINGSYSLVVDEHSMNFTKARNIIKIGGFPQIHFGGNLLFDSLGKLYLSVGDGNDVSQPSAPQNLNDYRGKILRLDVSKLKLEPETIAYGIRNPWGVTIDSKDRMFILPCGDVNVEAVYLLNDLYSGIPANLGWPVFEGSLRVRQDPLMFDDVLAPIFEYTKRPGCLTAGVYLNDIESLLVADYFGTIRLLNQKENGEWYLLHEDKQEKGVIWSFGLDKKTKKIFVAPNHLELEILVDQVKLNR